MFDIVTKHDYWRIRTDGRLRGLENLPSYRLKSVQDAVAYDALQDDVGARIGEVGGGHSRVLPALASTNECYNFEPFEGQGNGPVKAVDLEGVTTVPHYVGETEGHFPAERLDAIFSVSVVEHILVDQLDAFFADCRRLLRIGGRMVHLVDLYLGDAPQDDARLQVNLKGYNAAFGHGFVPAEPARMVEPADMRFSCAYATNPDNVMFRWNKRNPARWEEREQAQSVTLHLAGVAV